MNASKYKINKTKIKRKLKKFNYKNNNSLNLLMHYQIIINKIK